MSTSLHHPIAHPQQQLLHPMPLSPHQSLHMGRPKPAQPSRFPPPRLCRPPKGDGAFSEPPRHLPVGGRPRLCRPRHDGRAAAGPARPAARPPETKPSLSGTRRADGGLRATGPPLLRRLPVPPRVQVAADEAVAALPRPPPRRLQSRHGQAALDPLAGSATHRGDGKGGLGRSGRWRGPGIFFVHVWREEAHG